MASILITNGRVLSPGSSRTKAHDAVADVAIVEGRIAAIGRGLTRTAADTVIDAEGKLVVPGMIDPHVHLREPGQEHKETLATGTAAAVAGGFTTVCCMPNTSPAIDSPELVRFIEHRATATAACRVFAVAAATKGRRGDEMTEIGLLAQAGAVGFSDDGDCIASTGMMSRILQAVAVTGRAFMQHCQEPSLTQGASMHAGEVSVRLGLTGWPRVAEEIIVERDLRLNRGPQCRYHVQHISSAGTLELLKAARAQGQPATGEASPHHLLLTHDACDGYNTLAKVNPPLRESKDVQALRDAVAEGVVTVLATDHAPHSADEKAMPFEEAPFGLVGLETALPLYAEALVHSGLIDWPRLIALLTIEPAKLCGLDAHGLGTLAVAGPADVTIIDPDDVWTIQASTFAGRSRNTPFEGRAVRGRTVMTIVAGAVRHAATVAV